MDKDKIKLIIGIILVISYFFYIVLQLELVTVLRPIFSEEFISSIDRTAMPLIFHEGQGHPIILFMIWVYAIKSLLGIVIALVDNESILRYGIVAIVFILLMDKPCIYAVAIIYMLIRWFISLAKIMSEPHGYKVFKNGEELYEFRKY